MPEQGAEGARRMPPADQLGRLLGQIIVALLRHLSRAQLVESRLRVDA